jgi:hypothetical protein
VEHGGPKLRAKLGSDHKVSDAINPRGLLFELALYAEAIADYLLKNTDESDRAAESARRYYE